MKLVFRLKFRTQPGQSLWLKLATVLEEQAVRFEKVLPLQWINDEQWETVLEVQGGGPLRLESVYQFRDSSNGVELDEWHGPRIAHADPAMHDVVLLEDAWCSAGTVDYAFETTAFTAVLPVRWPVAKPEAPAGANHTLQLRMAAVPAGLVPCVVGGVRELGDWEWQQALPLHEVAANVWQTDLYLPDDWRVEYKYGLFDAELGRAVSLEEGPNRVLEKRAFGGRQWTRVSDEGYRRQPADLYRAAGVAIPVFSLRSEAGLGVGEFADLKLLGDWAVAAGLKLIQILPINDTTSTHDWRDSYPYSAISVFALHPLYLRLGDLGYPMPDGFDEELQAARLRLNALESVNYEAVMQVKWELTRRIFDEHRATLTGNEAFHDFVTANRQWLVPYAAFCVQRDRHGTADFSCWGDRAGFDREAVEAMAQPGHADWLEISYHLWLQYELDRQLADAVDHLHRAGLALKGDLPIGINRHSADAWSAPGLFEMAAQAGAPPDAFAIKGQNWGFPTYNWQAMRDDGYAWWRARFGQLSRYFDAYRIDHVLGFFRIWQIPWDQTEGIMGWFDPAQPIHRDEIIARGIPFEQARYCQPFIREEFLWERFGDTAREAKHDYLDDCGDGIYQLREFVATQRLISDHFAAMQSDDPAVECRLERLRDGLLDCASDVLFFEVAGSDGQWFHPRCSLQATRSFQELELDVQARLEALYHDYFYHRQEGFWQARGYEKLPVMRRASAMLLCGEDLGMVPACVPGVLRELGILSLEIQRMPKRGGQAFSDPAEAPYLSVVSPSTHDMATLRGWWREDPLATAQFAWQMLGEPFPPQDLSGLLAARIIEQHLLSPAMWAIFPLQDLLAIDEDLRHSNPEAERINVPAIRHFPWRYRLHLPLEKLLAAAGLNHRLAELIKESRRGVAVTGSRA